MMTLDEVWENQLKLSKYVAEVYDGIVGVWEIKAQWCEANGFEIVNDCFFCDYNKQEGCVLCPGVLVDACFRCFLRPSFNADPKEFYEKLCKLNEKRKKK